MGFRKQPRSGSPERVSVGGLSLRADMHPDDFGLTMDKLLNEGTTRKVYKLSDDLVLKVPLYDSCTDEQQCEVELWLKVETEDRPYFAQPFIWAEDFSWSVFELAHRVGSRSPCEIKDLYAVMQKYKVTDLHSGNMGWRITPQVEHPMVIDYAAIDNYS